MKHFLLLLPKILIIASVIAVILLEIFRGYFRDWKACWKKGGWFYLDGTHAVILCVLLGLMFFGDRAVRGAIQANDDHFAAATFSNLGHQLGRYLFVMLVSVYVTGLALHSRESCRLVFGMLLTSIVTALIVTLLKFTFLRARPFADLGPFSFFNLEGLIHDERTFQSFPSGDVAIVAGAAAYLFYMLQQPFFRWLPIVLLLSTAFSRISRNRHWPSDTAGSLLVALIAAKAIAHFSKTSNPSPPPRRANQPSPSRREGEK